MVLGSQKCHSNTWWCSLLSLSVATGTYSMTVHCHTEQMSRCSTLWAHRMLQTVTVLWSITAFANSRRFLCLHREQWGVNRITYWSQGVASLPHKCQPPLPSDRQHLSYDVCLEVKGEYYQNCCMLGCVTQCSQSAGHSYEQFLQVQQIGFVALGPLRHA